MPMEHFGISVVEALASGLIPVIHKSGGAWSDIIEFGKYGIGYEMLEPSHIAEKINIALEKWDHSWIHTAINQANNFSEEKFKERMTRILRKYYS
jgi:glycosyltransferase involved in cell wall biosynthesis